MNWTMLVIGILPLIAFAIIEYKAGVKQGVWAAIIMAIAFGIYSYFVFGEIDALAIIEISFIMVLGFISLKLKNSKFFKFQPVIVGVCITIFITYYQFFETPILVRMIPYVLTIQPEMKSHFENPQLISLFRVISGHLIIVFLLHSVIVAVAALRATTLVWIICRLAIYPLLFVLLVVDAKIFL